MKYEEVCEDRWKQEKPVGTKAINKEGEKKSYDLK